MFINRKCQGQCEKQAGNRKKITGLSYANNYGAGCIYTFISNYKRYQSPHIFVFTNTS